MREYSYTTRHGIQVARTVSKINYRRGLKHLLRDLNRLRPKGPPFPAAAARDREGIRQAVAAVRGMATGRIFAGGHSYGGHQTAMAAAENPGLADALLLRPVTKRHSRATFPNSAILILILAAWAHVRSLVNLHDADGRVD